MDANKIDVDALFKQYTIKEIQAIEQQIKNEIEKKKEDLRIMVYNRYRDLIEAADGIHIMKQCSNQIEDVLSNMHETCVKLFDDKADDMFLEQDNFKSSEKAKRNNKYALAVIVKILQNSPSKIWFHLDNNEYLKAAKLVDFFSIYFIDLRKILIFLKSKNYNKFFSSNFLVFQLPFY
ncbi:conserved oligomeric Golgi complex subunit 1 isoform X2 [Brachionus plicatilis]|uniref:Conserved oligomeric Golgi complex subunit 1 n=1 Tax=Brachionus plicatilis TaxID=10195 RepID=A0A3M7RBC7_BRAPC|nr:conserved oligomeric Golgi complex subunit 1 isoform X2 [Brachionus plicatilis]